MPFLINYQFLYEYTQLFANAKFNHTSKINLDSFYPQLAFIIDKIGQEFAIDR